jgi:hypothetical protein
MLSTVCFLRVSGTELSDAKILARLGSVQYAIGVVDGGQKTESNRDDLSIHSEFEFVD